MVSSFVKDEHLRQALSFHTLLVGGNPMNTSAIYALIHKLEKDGATGTDAFRTAGGLGVSDCTRGGAAARLTGAGGEATTTAAGAAAPGIERVSPHPGQRVRFPAN